MRKIAVVTVGRSDYGHLYWLIKAIQADSKLELQLIATGTHYSPSHGLTYQKILEDGFTIDARVEMLLSTNSGVGIAKSLGVGVMGFADAFHHLQPDMVVVLGDRFETLAAAQAALVLNIPVVHLHGGELSQGAMDDSIRHAITKLSRFHFVAADVYAQRVVQLGEDPNTVFNEGAPGLDWVKQGPLLSRTQIEKALSISLGTQNFLMTYYPETAIKQDIRASLQNIIQALSCFPEATLIFTYPGAEKSSYDIQCAINEFIKQFPGKAHVFINLGSIHYLSLMGVCDVMIGNSSSGIIEAPLFKLPTVNIGHRQTGRLKAASVIDCEDKTEAIVAAVKRALTPDFRERLKHVKSPYGSGDAAIRIKERLKKISLDSLSSKGFFDVFA